MSEFVDSMERIGAMKLENDHLRAENDRLRAQVEQLRNALMETVGVWCSHVPGDQRCAPIHKALEATTAPKQEEPGE